MRPEHIRDIAEQVGVNSLSDAAAIYLADDVTFTLKSILLVSILIFDSVFDILAFLSSENYFTHMVNFYSYH